MSDPVSPETAERADATLEELRRERDEAQAELDRLWLATYGPDGSSNGFVILSREDADAIEVITERLAAEVRGLLELDGYRPREGSVNPDWESRILSGAREALAAWEDARDRLRATRERT